MTDIPAIVQAVLALPKNERQVVYGELAARIFADSPDEPTVRLINPAGRCVGFLVATQRSVVEPRPLSPEERAENARRMANLDDAVTAKEIIALARTAGDRVPAGS